MWDLEEYEDPTPDYELFEREQLFRDMEHDDRPDEEDPEEIVHYSHDDEDSCNHHWVYTGILYDGDDESFHGEGRCYCSKCGADGDA